jgi:AAA domain
MRNKLVQTANVKQLVAAQTALTSRAPGQPGIGVVYGPAGFGKSAAVRWLATLKSGIFVVALHLMTARSMLATLVTEAGGQPVWCAMGMFNFLREELKSRPRPIFIDEGDAIVDKLVLTETLRQLHDLSGVPLLLVGMGSFRRKLSMRPQLERRILHEVEFSALTAADAQLMATELSEVRLSDDLVRELHRRSGGSHGLFCNELERAEAFGKRARRSTLSLEDYITDAAARKLSVVVRAGAA